MPKEKLPTIKVMVFGTFDGLHKGHLDFFKQARLLVTGTGGRAKKLAGNVFLIVSVARDKNVLRIKGRLPILNEQKRLALIKNSKLADKAVLSGTRDHIPHIVREKPGVIALGYDQKDYIKGLKKAVKRYLC